MSVYLAGIVVFDQQDPVASDINGPFRPLEHETSIREAGRRVGVNQPLCAG